MLVLFDMIGLEVLLSKTLRWTVDVWCWWAVSWCQAPIAESWSIRKIQFEIFISINITQLFYLFWYIYYWCHYTTVVLYAFLYYFLCSSFKSYKWIKLNVSGWCNCLYTFSQVYTSAWVPQCLLQSKQWRSKLGIRYCMMGRQQRLLSKHQHISQVLVFHEKQLIFSLLTKPLLAPELNAASSSLHMKVPRRCTQLYEIWHRSAVFRA